MGAKMLPTPTAFRAFERSLLKRGFRRLDEIESRHDFERLHPVPPLPREGREVGFLYNANGLTVVVWTTFVERLERAREQDAGWVLIKAGDAIQYSSRPILRTKNYLKTLLWAACIARLRVLNRPPCPTCGAWMHITRGRPLKARFWACRRKSHKKPTFLSWDYGLPKAALDYLHVRRKQRAQYAAKLRKEGKMPGRALLKRTGWKVGRPENIEPAR